MIWKMIMQLNANFNDMKNDNAPKCKFKMIWKMIMQWYVLWNDNEMYLENEMENDTNVTFKWY